MGLRNWLRPSSRRPSSTLPQEQLGLAPSIYLRLADIGTEYEERKYGWLRIGGAIVASMALVFAQFLYVDVASADVEDVDDGNGTGTGTDGLTDTGTGTDMNTVNAMATASATGTDGMTATDTDSATDLRLRKP